MPTVFALNQPMGAPQTTPSLLPPNAFSSAERQNKEEVFWNGKLDEQFSLEKYLFI